MSELEPLIRVRQYDVEQRQKFLADLYRQEEMLRAQKQQMLDDLAAEEAGLEGLGVEMLTYFATYRQAVQERIEEINTAITTVVERIDIAREALRAAFAELKKIEITDEARKAEILAELEKKESQMFDDIALQTYRKQQEEG